MLLMQKAITYHPEEAQTLAAVQARKAQLK
jgi:hypothetical protein